MRRNPGAGGVFLFLWDGGMALRPMTHPHTMIQLIEILLTPKKTDHDIKIVKVFKEIRTIAILMRKDARNPGKLVWRRYD